MQGARGPPLVFIGQWAAAPAPWVPCSLPPHLCADTLLPAEPNQSANVHTATVTYTDS